MDDSMIRRFAKDPKFKGKPIQDLAAHCLQVKGELRSLQAGEDYRDYGRQAALDKLEWYVIRNLELEERVRELEQGDQEDGLLGRLQNATLDGFIGAIRQLRSSVNGGSLPD